ncbi:hypothetical protein M0R45_008876 [Rubus argutus]|uniref:NB-ARC domain-containing protein n=1 Tax=Rubus argutus TaxID=59490 RepID=A0AAW1Y697_RUBAR
MAVFWLSVLGKLAEFTVAPVVRQFGYLIHYKSNIEDLTQRVTSLTAQRDGVQILVERANRNSEIILPEVENWLGQIDGLLTEGNFTTISCPAPAPKIEYPFIQYFEDSAEAPAKMSHEGSGVSNPPTPPAPMDLSDRLEYRLPYTRDLLKALQDDKINMIGISGIIREIDTVTTKEFIKRMKHRNLFDEVVMAVVSQDPGLKGIQGEVADILKLKVENGSLVERAPRQLHSKRLLLILADVWQVPDLEAIGISHGDSNKRCKIILISQLQSVFSEMRTRTNLNCYYNLLLWQDLLSLNQEFQSSEM